ncbi:MAG: VOC family protein [Mariniphaga sp.]|nr:VOC family protein [Mariniphaga sp.]
MSTVNIYLTFNGNCKEAFDFYKSILGGEFRSMSKFGDMPPMPEDQKKRIMHITLPVSKETVLMGSDSGGEWAKNFKQGNNFSVSVSTDSEEEADRTFNGLVQGGNAMMPMNKTFWGAYFGMLTDKFGINWIVSCEVKSANKMMS